MPSNVSDKSWIELIKQLIAVYIDKPEALKEALVEWRKYMGEMSYARETSPSGIPWKPLDPKYVKRKKRYKTRINFLYGQLWRVATMQSAKIVWTPKSKKKWLSVRSRIDPRKWNSCNARRPMVEVNTATVAILNSVYLPQAIARLDAQAKAVADKEISWGINL